MIRKTKIAGTMIPVLALGDNGELPLEFFDVCVDNGSGDDGDDEEVVLNERGPLTSTLQRSPARRQ